MRSGGGGGGVDVLDFFLEVYLVEGGAGACGVDGRGPAEAVREVAVLEVEMSST